MNKVMMNLAVQRAFRLKNPASPRQGMVRAKSTSNRFRFDPEASLMGRRKLKAGDLALLSFPAAAFALGVWQTRRRTWKLELIQELDSRTSMSPVDLPDRSGSGRTGPDRDYSTLSNFTLSAWTTWRVSSTAESGSRVASTTLGRRT